MSILPIFMALLFASMYSCNARCFPACFGINKDVANENTKQGHDMSIKLIPKETFSGDESISVATLDEGRGITQVQGLRRKERSLLISETHETTKEPSNNANDDESLEDAVVMDYVTPHRKSPIHNNHH